MCVGVRVDVPDLRAAFSTPPAQDTDDEEANSGEQADDAEQRVSGAQSNGRRSENCDTGQTEDDSDDAVFRFAGSWRISHEMRLSVTFLRCVQALPCHLRSHQLRWP